MRGNTPVGGTSQSPLASALTHSVISLLMICGCTFLQCIYSAPDRMRYYLFMLALSLSIVLALIAGATGGGTRLSIAEKAKELTTLVRRNKAPLEV